MSYIRSKLELVSNFVTACRYESTMHILIKKDTVSLKNKTNKLEKGRKTRKERLPALN